MASYSDLDVQTLLEAFASSAPAPGGGAAAAMAGAAGVSLLIMAGRIAKSPGTESTETATAIELLLSARHTLVALIDRDPESYSRVIEARRLPAHDVDAAAHRQTTIASAMRAATDTPLETMRACRRALAEAPIVVERTARSVHADVAVALELLRAAIRGAGITVDANLRALGDSEYVTRVGAERRQLESESAADAERASSRLSHERR